MGCSEDTPPIDDSCADPAYRAAHPDECKNFALLLLKPEYALTEPGKNVTYKVFLRANGVETEILLGLTWYTSNINAAMINPLGVATGVMAGQTTISVEWQNLSAQAQLDVVASCEETHQNFLVLIDNSKSMGQSFSSNYATKLAFSKAIAADFFDTINYSKDQASAWKFNDEATELEDWTVDPVALRSAVNLIAGSTGKTDLAGALEDAIAAFTGEVGVRVIVLFTDGEWTGDDPKPIAQAFKESGGFLVIVATHAWGTFFVDLAEMASGGFLLSAYGATQDSILDTLNGLKSFLCSGSCHPEPGTAPTAQLNYTGFINWDVTAGAVDLVGLGVWDVQPGNGLYVDMMGTDFIGAGQLTSKEDYDFTAGEDFRLTISIGGSKSNPATGTWTIRIQAGDELDEEVTISVGNQTLLPVIFNWTPASTHSGPIIITQLVPSGESNVGTLIDEITLLNVTTATTLLYDNFDTENPQTIPPGYNYFGCLETPPGSQSASPTPPTPRLTE